MLLGRLPCSLEKSKPVSVEYPLDVIFRVSVLLQQRSELL